jgi:hypothetical protein
VGIFGKGKQETTAPATAEEAVSAAAAPVDGASPDNFATFDSIEDYEATLPGASVTDVAERKQDSEAA